MDPWSSTCGMHARRRAAPCNRRPSCRAARRVQRAGAAAAACGAPVAAARARTGARRGRERLQRPLGFRRDAGLAAAGAMHASSHPRPRSRRAAHAAFAASCSPAPACSDAPASAAAGAPSAACPGAPHAVTCHVAPLQWQSWDEAVSWVPGRRAEGGWGRAPGGCGRAVAPGPPRASAPARPRSSAGAPRAPSRGASGGWGGGRSSGGRQQQPEALLYFAAANPYAAPSARPQGQELQE